MMLDEIQYYDIFFISLNDFSILIKSILYVLKIYSSIFLVLYYYIMNNYTNYYLNQKLNDQTYILLQII